MCYKLIQIVILIALVSACTSSKLTEHIELPTARKDQALIYFFRERKFVGGSATIYIYEGKENRTNQISTLENGTFFYIYREPGAYIFWPKYQPKNSVTINLAPGEIYYIEGEISWCILSCHKALSIVLPEDGEPEFLELNLITLP